MDDDLARLAFFLDPRYKSAVTVDMEALCVTVSTLHCIVGAAATALAQPPSSQSTVTPFSQGCMILLPQHLILYVAVQAVTVMQKRQQNAGFCELMTNQLMAYKSGVKPFSLACNLSTDPVVWWRSVAAGNAAAAGAVLLLVELLYGFTPHAAEPERLFSLLSFFDSPKRSRLSAKRLEMMAAITYHHRELAQAAK